MKGILFPDRLRAELGPEKSWKGIRLFTSRSAGRLVVSHDFELAMCEASGGDLKALFRKPCITDDGQRNDGFGQVDGEEVLIAQVYLRREEEERFVTCAGRSVAGQLFSLASNQFPSLSLE